MFSTSNPSFKHCSISCSSSGKDSYIYVCLSSALGRKRYSLGVASDDTYTKAVTLASQIDAYCASHKTINVADITEIVQRAKGTALKVVETISIKSIWANYVAYHKRLKKANGSPYWTETYLLTHIARITSDLALDGMAQDPRKIHLVFERLLQQSDRSFETNVKRLSLIVAAIRWAAQEKQIERLIAVEADDYLADKRKKLKQFQVKAAKSINNPDYEIDAKIDIFTLDEIEAIIDAFRTEKHAHRQGDHYQYWHYVRFLWLTGCRPSEAIALKWDAVYSNKIVFKEVEIRGSHGVIKREGTKTEAFRVFTINDDLRELLDTIPRTGDYVFLRKDGNPINQHSFNGVWNRLLKKMDLRHRVPYQLRHSMISHHANNGYPVTKLAKLVGNSETIIRTHYLKMNIDYLGIPSIE